MRGRDQILRVGRIGAAGMQRDVTGRGADAAVIVAGIVEGIGRHQQRFARPVGIRMLAVDFLEFLRRRLVILALVHQVQALIVELVRGFLVEGVVLGGELVPQRTGAASAQGNRQHDQARRQPQRPADPDEAGSDDLRGSSVIRCADMELRPDAFDAVDDGARPSMNRGHGRISVPRLPVAPVVQPRACVAEKWSLTNRIRSQFARIKAAGRASLPIVVTTENGRRCTARKAQDISSRSQDISKTKVRTFRSESQETSGP